MKEWAKRVVGIVQSYTREEWKDLKVLSDEDAGMLLFFLTFAGFKVEGSRYGRIKVAILDEDRSPTGEYSFLTELCPLVFLCADENGHPQDHEKATYWLECIFQLILGWQQDNNQLVERVGLESERSKPLDPIPLGNGNFLCEYPPSGSGLVDHSRDHNDMGHSAGTHRYCGGYMDRHRATETDDAISCRKCRLRVQFSREVQTYGALRAALSP